MGYKRRPVTNNLLSVIIITKNEESNIEDCLKSVAFADEIILVDSGSTDRTLEIASKYTSKIYTEAWRGFGPQKQFALDKATCQWVFSIDADERVPEKLKTEILAAIKSEDYKAYKVPRLSFVGSKPVRFGSWHPDYILRLFKRSESRFTSDSVHERVITNGTIGFLKEMLIHYSYANTEKLIEGTDYYSTLGAEKLFENGKTSHLIKACSRGSFAFIKSYFLKLGFLDGVLGISVAYSSGRTTYWKYIKLRQIHSAQKTKNSFKEITSILISRTDAIGDVILTLPMLGLLKKQYPEVKIYFLCRDYTSDIVAACDFVDQVISWDHLQKLNTEQQSREISKYSIDIILHVYPRKEIAQLAKAVGISHRIGTRNRLYHWWTCNIRPALSRKTSGKHEALLNIQLAELAGLIPWGKSRGLSIKSNDYGLSIKDYWPDFLTNNLRKKIILHPGSNQSSRHWPVKKFAQLALQLSGQGFEVFITGTENEGQSFRNEFTNLNIKSIHDLTGKLNLEQLTGFIKHCDALVACSTGPLHIAAAAGIKAIGIYPKLASIGPKRWAPLGDQAIVITSLTNNDCRNCSLDHCPCIDSIEVSHVVSALK